MNTSPPHSKSAVPAQCLHNAHQGDYMEICSIRLTTFL